MEEELQAIHDHGVFGDGEFVDLPEGRRALPSHWVYKVKRDGAGTIQRFKARLVCGGNHQQEGIDYKETYAPTARLSHVRLALAIAAKYGLELQQMDFCTAFLGVPLEEEIYMVPPQGYGATGGIKRKVLRLRKSLYGLKQSPHVWYGTFKDFLVSIGFVPSRVDGGLFILRNASGEVDCVLVLFVDDLLLLGALDIIENLKKRLMERFRMHDLGAASHYLGMVIERDTTTGTIAIHQHAYIQSILEKFGMGEAKPVATPIAMKLHKRRESEEACDKELYQSMIGSLMYAMLATRPDLAHAVGVVSRYSHDPSKEHMTAVKRIFRYIAGTRNWKLILGGATVDDDTGLVVYTDSDYAGDPDDYRSTSGLCVAFGGAMVDWRSRKQKSTAQSTTDAEYYAFGVRCMRTIQLVQILHELGVSQRPILNTDSQSMLASIKGNIYRGTQITHIATKFHLAAEMVRNGEIELRYVATVDMVADAMTKALPRPVFLPLCRRMGLCD